MATQIARCVYHIRSLHALREDATLAGDGEVPLDESGQRGSASSRAAFISR